MRRTIRRFPAAGWLSGCGCLIASLSVCGADSPEPAMPRPRMHGMPPGGQHQQQFAMPSMPGMPPMPTFPGMPPMPGMPGAGQPQPALGVVASPVGPQLQAQLSLPDGMGLIVDELDPAGAAAAAGIQRFDILRKFNDQLLCSPQQLMALAKEAGKGKEVNLTVIRAAQERELAVTLGDPQVRVATRAAGGRAEARAQAQAGGWAQGGGRAGAQAGGNAVPGGRWQTHHTEHREQVVSESNEHGTVEIRETNGVRTVRVRDAAGQEVYAGPLNTDADWQAVPGAFQDMARAVAGKLGG